ncbi:MAG: hypothetical protein ACHQAY_23270 [Hyphomicrobiales bacterium]
MARIRVRFELNKGRTGAPLAKLGKIAEQAEKFLKALAAEISIEQRAGDWLAVNFKNGSVSYDAEFQGEVSAGQAMLFNKHLEFVADYDPEREGPNGLVGPSTIAEFARMGSLIDPDEVIGVGVYRNGSKPIWRRISYAHAAAIRQEVEAPLPTYGGLQGIIHSLYKEARHPSFQLRELSTDALVRCFYIGTQYPLVAEVLQERTAIVNVAGDIVYDRVSRSATELKLERIEKARVLTPAEFESFFGSAPKFTGDMSTDQYIDEMRADG